MVCEICVCMSYMGWKSEVNEMRRDEMIVSDVCALNLVGVGGRIW